MNKQQLLQRLKGLRGDRRKRAVCGLVGHSKLRTFCFGYNYCGRCDAQIGDSLGGSWKATNEVIQGHDGTLDGCHCPENFKKLTWRDTYLVNGWQRWMGD